MFVYPQIFAPTRPKFWFLTIESDLIRALCPHVLFLYETGEITRKETERQITEALRQRIGRLLRRLGLRHVEADDLLSDLLLRIHDRNLAGRFDPNSCRNPWGFILGIVRNLLREPLRRKSASTVVDSTLVEVKPFAGGSPVEAAIVADQMRRVREQYLKLPARQRHGLRVFFPFLEPEAAAAVPSTRSADYVNKHRALRSLQSALADQSPGRI